MADITLRYYRNNVLNTDFYPEQDKETARKAYRTLLDEFNKGLIYNFMVICPDGKVINVTKTINTTYVVKVRFSDNSKTYPYEADEYIPVGQTILVDAAGMLKVVPVVECTKVEKSDLKQIGEGHHIKKVLAICVKTMKQIRKEGA